MDVSVSAINIINATLRHSADYSEHFRELDFCDHAWEVLGDILVHHDCQDTYLHIGMPVSLHHPCWTRLEKLTRNRFFTRQSFITAKLYATTKTYCTFGPK